MHKVTQLKKKSTGYGFQWGITAFLLLVAAPATWSSTICIWLQSMFSTKPDITRSSVSGTECNRKYKKGSEERSEGHDRLELTFLGDLFFVGVWRRCAAFILRRVRVPPWMLGIGEARRSSPSPVLDYQGMKLQARVLSLRDHKRFWTAFEACKFVTKWYIHRHDVPIFTCTNSDTSGIFTKWSIHRHDAPIFTWTSSDACIFTFYFGADLFSQRPWLTRYLNTRIE